MRSFVNTLFAVEPIVRADRAAQLNDINNTGTTHPHGINSSGLGTAITSEGNTFNITGGTQKGGNLFHSFEKFNLHSGENAVFHDAGITNTIGRITGGEYSWINGKITSGAENLYLLNPAGIMFGADASLDLTGSFHVTTSDYLKLGENDKFYAVPKENEILSIAAPSAFGFIDENIAAIYIEGKGEITESEWDGKPVGLSVSEGNTISLIGGDIEITKGAYYNTITSTPWGDWVETTYLGNLNVSGGCINLVSAASSGEIEISENHISGSLSKWGDITITEKSLLDVSGTGAGNIFIRGGGLFVDDSYIKAKTTGEKDGGKIAINCDSVSFKSGANIFGRTEGIGRGPDVEIIASDSVYFDGFSNEGKPTMIQLQTGYDNPDSGDSGNLLIEAEHISFTNQAIIESSTYGKGRAGNVTLSASDSVIFDIDNIDSTGSGIIQMVSGDENAGDAGELLIEAKNISFLNGGYINLLTGGSGNAGKVTLSASETVTFAGQSPLTVSAVELISTPLQQDKPAGNAGSLFIEAQNILFADGSYINSNTFGKGSGGEIVLRASENITFTGYSDQYGDDTGSSINLATGYKGEGAGSGGSLLMEAENITFNDGAHIFGSTAGWGNAGTIHLHAENAVAFTSKGIGHGDMPGETSTETITAKVESVSTGGHGSNVSIEAKEIILNNGGSIKTSTLGSGNAGNIDIKADKMTIIGSESGIYAGSEGTGSIIGSGGQISISANTLVISENGEISSSTAGGGNAGEIKLNVSQLQLDTSASISSQSRFVNIYQFADINERDQLVVMPGDIIDVADSGYGFPIRYVHTGGRVIQAFDTYPVENMDELNIITAMMPVWEGTIAEVADDGTGTPATLILIDNNWIKVNQIHSAADMTEMKKFIAVHAGSIAEIKNDGQGNPGKFVCSGKKWIALNKLYLADNTEQRDTLTVQTGDVVKITDEKSSTFLYSEGEWIEFTGGNAGTIEINTDSISMQDNSHITTSTQGHGNAGNIILTSDRLELGNSASVDSTSASTEFGGQAGIINISAKDSLRITGKASLTTEAKGAGGGKINVNAGNQIYLLNGEITSSVKQGYGKGGDVTANSEFMILNHSNITANAEEGDGGAVFIQTDQYMKSSDSIVEATSARGNQGQVKIQAPDIDVSAGLTVMPGTFIDATQWAATPCENRSAESVSHFIIKGKDATPTSVEDWRAIK